MTLIRQAGSFHAFRRMLERLNRAGSDFLGNISHEMKTPLAVISSYAGLTISQLQKNAVDDQTEDNLDRVQQEAVRLGRLVEQLMRVSREPSPCHPRRH